MIVYVRANLGYLDQLPPTILCCKGSLRICILPLGITSVSLSFDRALTVGDYRALLSIVGAANFQDLLTTDSTYQKCNLSNQPSRKSNLESELMIRYADVINAFQKQIDDYPDHACCSCERLHQRKAVSVVTLSDELDSRIWPILRNFITDNDPLANDKVLYMCNYYKPMIRQGKLPGRCVLNGLLSQSQRNWAD